MKAIRKGATVVFRYEGGVLTRTVHQKSGSQMLVSVPVKYINGEVHQSRCYVPCANVIEVI